MTNLLAARSQMALSLGFHIVFAVVGVAMPLLMVIAEGRWLKSGSPVDLELAKRWAKGTAIMFAVGAVSGTVLSFELGLLWPEFMEHAGPIVGMPFSLEGFAFFLEAIFLGIYLYGWKRISPRAHLLSGIGVLIAGTASAIFVVSANAWMNAPTGFRVVDGELVDVDAWQAMFNPMWFGQALHMTIASFFSVGFAVAGIHAWMLLRQPENLFHQRALAIALSVGGIAAVLMPLSGDLLAKRVADTQPVKLAALEGQWRTQAGAPLRIGGWPDEETETTSHAIEIPRMLSVLAHGDPDAVVRGLEEFPRDERPPVAIVHAAFQIMVGIGFYFLALTAVAAFLAWRRRGVPRQRWFLLWVALSLPLGVVGVEVGWIVTEVGRQPWIIVGVMRVADSVTPMPGLVVPFTVFTLVYLVLGAMVVFLMRRHVFGSPVFDAGEVS